MRQQAAILIQCVRRVIRWGSGSGVLDAVELPGVYLGETVYHNPDNMSFAHNYCRLMPRAWNLLQQPRWTNHLSPNTATNGILNADTFRLRLNSTATHSFMSTIPSHSSPARSQYNSEQLAMVARSPSRAVAVYCAASLGKQKAFQAAALSLGYALSIEDRPLIYGGGNSGLMGVVSGAVSKSEGKVTGIIPYAIFAAGGEKDKGNGRATAHTVSEVLDDTQRQEIETIVVNSMHERKVEMAKRVGAFVGLPGGFGTFEEILEVITWNQLNIHNKPVVLLNVLSYYNPLRELIKNGIQEGFINPRNEHLVIFVDGPADHKEHEAFDWGKAALEAIDSWQYDKSQILPFHWNKDEDTSDLTNVKAEMNGTPPMLHALRATNGWLKRVWHVRVRSRV